MDNLRAEDDSRISACKSCGAEIVWMKTKNDKNICVDVPPVEDPIRDEVMEATLFDRERFTTHFETCVNEAQHRKPRASSALPSNDAGVNAKRLNTALAALENIAGSLPDGMRSAEIAKAALSQIRATR